MLTPTNLFHGAKQGHVQPGTLVMLHAVGSVSSASAAVVRWGEVGLGPTPAGGVPCEPDARDLALRLGAQEQVHSAAEEQPRLGGLDPTDGEQRRAPGNPLFVENQGGVLILGGDEPLHELADAVVSREVVVRRGSLRAQLGADRVDAQTPARVADSEARGPVFFGVRASPAFTRVSARSVPTFPGSAQTLL